MERSVVAERRELVRLALLEGANRRELCRWFGASPRIGYEWPARPAGPVKAAVLAVREAHPCRGGRKIKAVLVRAEGTAVPAASAVMASLRWHRRAAPEASLTRQPCRRFERAAPDELWQTGFKFR